MKRFLTTILAVICVGLASAQWTKPTVVATSDSILDNAFYLYNIGTQMFLTHGNAYGTQASVADEGLMIKVRKYQTEETEWDGKTYTIQCFRPVQNKWYHVFIDGSGNCFMDRASQGDYFWELTQKENGFWQISCAEINPTYNYTRFKNSCAGVVRTDSEDMNTVVDPVINLDNIDPLVSYHLDWAFISEAAYAEYAEKLLVYNTAMKLKDIMDDLEGRSISTAELKTVFDNSNSTLDELLEAVKQGEYLISIDDEQKVTPDNPKDFSDRIVNPNFDVEVKGGNGGWTKEGAAKTFEINGWVPDMLEDVMVAPALNLWGANQDILVSQVVDNIPNGIYQVTAGVYSQANGPFIFANDGKANVTTGGPTPYSVLAYVNDHTVKIGVGFPAEGTQWVMADCFRLLYFGNGYDAYKMWIEKTIGEDDPYKDKICYIPLKEAYEQSLNTLIHATTQEQLQNELPTFTLLYDSIKSCVAAYDEYLTVLNEAKEMTWGHAYYGDEFDILCDYVHYEGEPDDVFPNGTSTFIIANGTLNTEEIKNEKIFLQQLIQNVLDNGMGVGADATAKLTNANFENGLTGWLYNKKLGTPSPGGLPTNQCVERWNQNFDFYQVVSMPNGVYKLDVQAFYRTAANSVAESEWNKEQSEVLTAIYANNGETLVKNIYSEAQEEGFYKEDNAYMMNGGKYVPNTMKTASEAFNAGLYENTVKGVVWNGKLRVGIRSLNAEATDRWSIWDNFRITFLGMEVEPIAECYDMTISEAEELLAAEDVPEDLKSALQTAMAVNVDKTNAEETLSAITSIREAMEAVSGHLTGIDTPTTRTSANGTVMGIYTYNGTRVKTLQKGINMVRMSNGVVKKVLKKSSLR